MEQFINITPHPNTMKLKQVIPIIVAIILIGVVITVLTGPSTPEVEDDNQETSDTGGETTDSGSETPDSGGETTDTEGETTDTGSNSTDDTSTEANMTMCLDIPPGISREYEIIRVEGEVNSTITLDAGTIFGISANEYEWSQRFASMESLQYMSNHKLTIINPDNETATVNVTYPGVYRIELAADGETYEMELKVTKEGKQLEVKGINFIDLFGETGGAEFNIYPDDPECFQKALDHALAGPERAGVEWIGLVSGGFYSQVDPPIIQDDDHYLSNSDEYFYGEFVEAAHSRGFKVMEMFQDGPSIWFTPEQHQELAKKRQTVEWWDHWYEEWEVFMLRRLEMAERHGVDAVVLLMFVETTLDPVYVPDSGAKWTDMIHNLREVYSGEIGINFVNLDERFTFVEEVDFLEITFFGGLWTSRVGAIANISEPSMEELMAINDDMFEGIGLYDSKGKPIYAVLTIDSTDAQYSTEDPALRTATDFNEQVLYYEAFYTSVDEYDWIKGVITERWDYWDEYRRFSEEFDVQYFDETNAASPRNKPAEDVVTLWHEIFRSP